jgi:hypothetical protein
VTNIIRRRSAALAAVLSGTLLLGGCATLGIGAVVQPPRIAAAEGRDAELRLELPTANRPLGGATLRIWAQVENPNAFGLTLASLVGNLYLEGTRATTVDFPLGLPLEARASSVVPIDLTFSFADAPDMVNVAQRILTQNRVAYRVDGTLGVDAGPLGQPSFGPRTWLQGESRILR